MPPGRRFVGLSLGALLSATACCSGAPAVAQQLSGSRGHYRITILVPVKPEKAWQVLTRYEAMAGQMPDIRQARVLSRSGSQLELAQTYQAQYTFGLPIKARLRLTETPPRQVAYTMVSGDRIRSLSGSWTITPVRGGVTVEHRIDVDPDVPEVLLPVYYELSEANLLESMRVLRKLMVNP